MRGKPDQQLAMLSSLSTEDLIPKDHPIRRIRRVVDEVLAEMDGEFDAMYSRIGRPSVPPEQLLKATILMALYTVRSERAFCERLNYDLLFKWFLDLAIDAKSFDPTTFTKNRDRLLEREIADRFFAAVVRQAQLRRYMSSEHFSVDGTLLQAWASHKSFKPKDGSGGGPAGPGRNAEVGWHGQKRSNQTHESTTDPEARLYRKSHNTAAMLCYSGHLLMETPQRSHRRRRAHGRRRLRRTRHRTADARPAPSHGPPPDRRWRQGLRHARLCRRRQSARVHAPRRADTTGNDQRSTVAPTRHPGHGVSMRIRKRIEEPFGWMKTVGGSRKLRYIGRQRNRAWFEINAAVYNLIRITALDAAATTT
jgi:transposase